jgi:hypothetical protein
MNPGAASMGALVPNVAQYGINVVTNYEDFKALLEEEYDKEIKNDKER